MEASAGADVEAQDKDGSTALVKERSFGLFSAICEELSTIYYLCLNEGPRRRECFILIPSFSPLT